MHADVIIDVPFHDVDTMNVVWHGHYLKYFENVRYVQGIEFEQKIRVRAILKEWENRLKIEYQIFDATTAKRLTKGYTSQVAVHIETREMCFQSPQVLLDCLNAWPEFKAE